MSVTWQQNEFRGPPHRGLLDRLVDGSLPEAERREFLLQLESEPDGWRRCALAFLEAQTWREAFAPMAAAASAKAPLATSTTRPPMPKPWRKVVRWASLAVCVLAAFALGWASKPERHSQFPQEIAQANPAPVVVAPETVVDANVAWERPAMEREPSNAVLDSVVRSWEQLGYSAERQNALVTMRLRDGSELEVPAQEIKLRYTGDRTY